MRNVAVYEARVAYGFTALLPALILPLYAMIGGLTWVSGNHAPLPDEIARAFGLVLPLTAALSAAHLMGIERDENFDALRRSYAEPSWRLPLVRTVGALLTAALSVGIAVAILRLAGVAYRLDEIVLPAVPAALLMVMLALLANNITGNLPAAVVLVVGYWFMEMQTHGEVTGALFLFNSVFPRAGLDPDLNRLLVLAAALALCLANVAWSARRRRVGG